MSPDEYRHAFAQIPEFVPTPEDDQFAYPALVVVDDTTPPATTQADLFGQLREAIANADRMLPHLAGHPEELAFGIDAIRTLRRDLATLERRAEELCADAMDTKVMEVEGLGAIERTRATVRREWKSDDLVKEIVTVSLIDQETAEIPSSPVEAVARVVTAIQECAPLTSSTGWRIRALEKWGISPEDFCCETPGKVSIRIHQPGEGR